MIGNLKNIFLEVKGLFPSLKINFGWQVKLYIVLTHPCFN